MCLNDAVSRRLAAMRRDVAAYAADDVLARLAEELGPA